MANEFDEDPFDYITNVEIILTIESGKRRIIDLDREDKKIIISVLANYFKNGIPTSEFDPKTERTMLVK